MRPPTRSLAVAFLLAGCASADSRQKPASSSSPLPRAVTVGTYNVLGLDARDRLRADFASLAHVDVWCLQEVRLSVDEGDDAAADRLRRLLPPGMWHVAIERVNRNGDDWECQAIVSRLPIRDRATWPLDDAPDARRRVALSAMLDLGGATLRVVNTDHAPSYFATRDRNSGQLARLVDGLVTTDGPTVVAGDFNCGGSLFRGYDNATHVARVDRRLAAIGFRAAAGRANTFRVGLVAVRIDRLYARGVAVDEGRVAADARGSDHRPVWCVVR